MKIELNQLDEIIKAVRPCQHCFCIDTFVKVGSDFAGDIIRNGEGEVIAASVKDRTANHKKCCNCGMMKLTQIEEEGGKKK